jgi:hypothetical protein
MARGLPQEAEYQLRPLLFGLLAGPVIWSLYFMAGYGLTEFACKMGLLSPSAPQFNWVTITIFVLTLLSLGLVVYAAIYGYRNWDRLNEAQLGASEHDLILSTKEFLAVTGIFLNILFAVIILFTGIPPLFLATC